MSNETIKDNNIHTDSLSLLDVPEAKLDKIKGSLTVKKEKTGLRELSEDNTQLISGAATHQGRHPIA